MNSQFKVGVIVGAHRDPEQLAVLLAALCHPQVHIYLHIDKRARIRPFQAAIAAARVGHITWLNRSRTPWGTDRLVRVELDGMAHAIADRCDYVTIMSGQDFPLRPVAEFVKFLEANRDRTYIHHFQLPYEGWKLGGKLRTDYYTYVLLGHPYTCVPRHDDTGILVGTLSGILNAILSPLSWGKPARRFPSHVTPVGGEHWMNLNAEAAAYVLSFVREHPDYVHYHRHTASASEMFIQSILAGTEFADSHEIVNDDLRYIIWDDKCSKHPKTLSLEDGKAMLASSDFFARKVSAAQDPALFARLRERVEVYG
jgi:hypothetical protein